MWLKREPKGRWKASPGRFRGDPRDISRDSPGSGPGEVPEASFGTLRDASECTKMYEIHKNLRFC
jgi:hypothetical protein